MRDPNGAGLRSVIGVCICVYGFAFMFLSAYLETPM